MNEFARYDATNPIVAEIQAAFQEESKPLFPEYQDVVINGRTMRPYEVLDIARKTMGGVADNEKGILMFVHALLAAGASEGQAVCVDCGDTIMAHDPGTCGNCHSMKYVPDRAELTALRERIAGMEKDAYRKALSAVKHSRTIYEADAMVERLLNDAIAKEKQG